MHKRIASSLPRALKQLCIMPVFLAIEAEILRICISSVSLLSRTIPNNFRKVEVSNLTPHKDVWCGRAVLDLETMIE